MSPTPQKVALVTGAARGIGLAVAKRFLADGWRGALVATFTSWLPAFLSIPLRAGYRRLEARPWLGGLTWGVAAAGTGLLMSLAVSLTVHSLTGWREVMLGIITLVLLFRRLPSPVILAIAGLAGALFLR